MKPSRNVTSVAAEDALRDLENRTLARLGGDFARLVYLASSRDYNTGRYAHDGLAFRFSEAAAQQALSTAHRTVFASLALRPLRVLVADLEQYVRSGCARPNEILTAWNTSEAYRVLPPATGDPLMVKLFNSNVKIALAVVTTTCAEIQPVQDPQCASQPLLPVQ